MLTKSDLAQIGELIETKTRNIVQQETRSIIREETRNIVQEETRIVIREETRNIVQEETRIVIREETRNIVQEETRNIIQQELKPIKQDIKKIRQQQNEIINFFDTELNGVKMRVDKLEASVKTIAPQVLAD